MTDNTPGGMPPDRTLAALRELIGALDRRVPQVERAGETQIARDAQTLRRAAAARIEELTRAESDQPYDDELVEAIMTDDGGAPAVTLERRGPLERDRPGQKMGAGRPARRDPGLRE